MIFVLFERPLFSLCFAFELHFLYISRGCFEWLLLAAGRSGSVLSYTFSFARYFRKCCLPYLESIGLTMFAFCLLVPGVRAIGIGWTGSRIPLTFLESQGCLAACFPGAGGVGWEPANRANMVNSSLGILFFQLG